MSPRQTSSSRLFVFAIVGGSESMNHPIKSQTVQNATAHKRLVMSLKFESDPNFRIGVGMMWLLV